MANQKISQFTQGVTPTDNDEIAGYLSGGGAGSNRQWKFSQIFTYLIGGSTVSITTSSSVGVMMSRGQVLATSRNMDNP